MLNYAILFLYQKKRRKKEEEEVQEEEKEKLPPTPTPPPKNNNNSVRVFYIIMHKRTFQYTSLQSVPVPDMFDLFSQFCWEFTSLSLAL